MNFKEMIESNEWHSLEELDSYIAAIKKFSRSNLKDWHWSKSKNWECKYVNIRVDMRDGGFIVTGREGNRIDLEALSYQRGMEDDSE